VTTRASNGQFNRCKLVIHRIIHIKGLTRHKHIGRLRTVSNPKETLTPEYGAHSDKQLRKGPCRNNPYRDKGTKIPV
jgi:hypothetical protein